MCSPAAQNAAFSGALAVPSQQSTWWLQPGTKPAPLPCPTALPTTPNLRTAAQHLAELGAAQLLGVQALRLSNIGGHIAAKGGGQLSTERRGEGTVDGQQGDISSASPPHAHLEERRLLSPALFQCEQPLLLEQPQLQGS